VTDLLLVCLGATAGLRAAEAELEASLERAGASVARVTAAPPREVRTFMATDLSWALAARRAAMSGLTRSRPRAILYSTTTAALLWPRPGAIRFDALAAETRPGRHGLWQRPVEARRLQQAPLLVPQSPEELYGPSVVVPIPVEPSGPTGERDVAAMTYGAHWRKKGLDRVLAAWSMAEGSAPVVPPATIEAPAGARVVAPAGAPGELVVTGVDASLVAAAWAAGGGAGGLPASVRVTGPLAPVAYRALLRRARVFVTAPRREDYGVAQLEALADGCALVTTVAPGPYAALPLARALDPRLVVEDAADVTGLAWALRTALEATTCTDERLPATGEARAAQDERRAPMGVGGVDAHQHSTSSYASRAAQKLAPFSRAAVDRIVAEELLPRLLG